MSNQAHFLFQASALKRLKRAGFQLLGDHDESIAEHTYMVSTISFLLARKTKADMKKVLLMSLFHDLEEARTGDVFRLAKQYVTIDKKKAIEDTWSFLPDARDVVTLLHEYEKRESLEAKIVKDADTLALCAELKPMVERGNVHAKEWLDANIKQLYLKESKELAEEILTTDSQAWWTKEKKKIHKENVK